MKSEDNTTAVDAIIRLLEYGNRQKEVLEGILQQSRTSQKESKAKEEDLKTKLQILEKKLRDKEQDNVILKKAHKEEVKGIVQQLRTSQKESKAKEEDLKTKLQILEKKLRDKEQDNVILKEGLDGIVQQLRTSQKESKAKVEDLKTKLQIQEKKLRDKEQDNVILKKAHKEELDGIVQQLRTSQKESKAKVEDLKTKLQILEKKLRDKEQDNVILKKAHKEELDGIVQQLRTNQKESKAKEEDFKMKLQTLEKELRDREQDNVVLNKDLSEANKSIANYKSQLETRDWVISRDDISVSNTCLGSGGCGLVLEGRYCGCAVAIKKLHSLTSHERKLFQREMDIASRCRHPCLLQFIGATNDEENPLFVTELMEKSLRKLLHEQPKKKLSDAEIAIICLDVARALNYLHQRKPIPIVHRDVSSANVLLWRRGNKWRGKLSDYGTARLVEEMMTRSPGAMIYSAPEAATRYQTVKVSG